MNFVEIVKPDINLDFVGKRRIAYAVSAMVILVGLISLIVKGGPNYGIDFLGGTLVQVRVDGPIKAPQVRDKAVELGLSDATVQTLGTAGKEFLIRTSRSHIEGEELRGRLTSSLAKLVGEGKVEVRRIEMVGPKVGQDLRQKALFAVLYSLLFMAIYISGRFELKWVPPAVMAVALVAFSYFLYTWAGLGLSYVILASFALILALSVALNLRYAMGAIVALLHDVIVVMGVFSIFNLEVSVSMVAALLTIIGYSVHDTIIVFDRIRENLRRYSRSSLESIVNRSINQTLSRTILTSGTVLIVLVAFLALGGGVIREFALAMFIGVLTGTYSSVYVASPILLAWPEKRAAAPRKQPAAAPATPAAPAPPQVKRAEARGRRRKKSRPKKAEAAGGS
jgi:preprotein translocase subunit SecF